MDNYVAMMRRARELFYIAQFNRPSPATADPAITDVYRTCLKNCNSLDELLGKIDESRKSTERKMQAYARNPSAMKLQEFTQQMVSYFAVSAVEAMMRGDNPASRKLLKSADALYKINM